MAFTHKRTMGQYSTYVSPQHTTMAISRHKGYSKYLSEKERGSPSFGSYHCLMKEAGAGIKIIEYNFLLETFGVAMR